MKITAIVSKEHLEEVLKSHPRAFVLIYKKGSETSDCAYASIEQVDIDTDGFAVFSVDVSVVRDVHAAYGITTAPALLEFVDAHFQNIIKGCNGPEYFSSYFQNALYVAKSGAEGPSKSVTVYSTPSCSWCTTLKNHLRKHGIRYHEIDVAADQNAAEEMTRKSGQRGVPQTDIDGEMIVGFDKTRINTLLGINN
jgi:glutaredoxin-like YruB-family protein